ncbi:uncharacterized protein LOC126370598 [Pectinophora gossypiella]|uniref:uncharacterized protein LOC126370598 n=1 Tax=Pectinophora gossypiella TaxID=13191 RepID=UPI00214E79B4|nr:uncharacterized protein LOC126370598 [Pectinophora gossypiella]
MLASLSDSSVRQYDTCLRKWYQFCNAHNFNVFEASIPNVIYFLTKLFEAGAQYGTLNSCRSALSLILGVHVGNDDRMKRFFKGVFKLRTPLPKYNVTWDTSTVLDTLATWYPNENLNLDKLSKKISTLLALVTAHRLQTLSKININNIERFPDKVIIKIPDLIKTSRIGSLQPVLVLPYFRDRPEVCPVNVLLRYLDMTDSLRGNNHYLFIGIKKPHKSVSSQTLSRWVKSTLSECGINVSVFTAHSTRHAATSRAHQLGVNLDLIRKTAGWSGSSNVFGRFYNRVVGDIIDHELFARSIINNDSLH